VRLVFLGTPDVAVAPLRALHVAGHRIALVVTGPDRRRGRGGATSPSPVKAAALELGLDVSSELDDVLGVDAELGVVVAYGRIVPARVLDALPMVNLHFSLLPRWRGAAPVERAILAGDRRTGVCLMQLEEGLDTGGVHACVEVDVDDHETAAQLRDRLSVLGAALLVDALENGLGEPTPQPEHGVTYASKLEAADRRLDWADPAIQLDRVVRIGSAWTTLDGARLKVLAARPVDPPDGTEVPGTVTEGPVVRCGEGALLLERVGPEGRPAMPASDWANGARPLGRRLGT
jgi:methionyl-tRNA formyltransferase